MPWWKSHESVALHTHWNTLSYMSKGSTNSSVAYEVSFRKLGFWNFRRLTHEISALKVESDLRGQNSLLFLKKATIFFGGLYSAVDSKYKKILWWRIWTWGNKIAAWLLYAAQRFSTCILWGAIGQSWASKLYKELLDRKEGMQCNAGNLISDQLKLKPLRLSPAHDVNKTHGIEIMQQPFPFMTSDWSLKHSKDLQIHSGQVFHFNLSHASMSPKVDTYKWTWMIRVASMASNQWSNPRFSHKSTCTVQRVPVEVLGMLS